MALLVVLLEVVMSMVVPVVKRRAERGGKVRERLGTAMRAETAPQTIHSSGSARGPI